MTTENLTTRDFTATATRIDGDDNNNILIGSTRDEGGDRSGRWK